MTTRAYLKGQKMAIDSSGLTPADSVCRNLHDECKHLCARIRDEMDKAIIPVRATHIGFLVFAAMFLLCGLLIIPIMHKGEFVLERLILAAAWGFFAGFAAFAFGITQKAKQEISNYLYLRISEERSNYPDLDGLRLGGVPLSLGALSGHMHDLMRALESDINHPARNTFRWKEDEDVELFQFNHKPKQFY